MKLISYSVLHLPSTQIEKRCIQLVLFHAFFTWTLEIDRGLSTPWNTAILIDQAWEDLIVEIGYSFWGLTETTLLFPPLILQLHSRLTWQEMGTLASPTFILESWSYYPIPLPPKFVPRTKLRILLGAKSTSVGSVHSILKKKITKRIGLLFFTVSDS